MEAELGALRSVTVGAPYPIWMEDRDGNIGWRNKAYEDLRAETSADNTDEIPLFDMRNNALTTGTTDRLSVRNHRAKTLHWFNVTATEASGSTVYHAVNINAVIEAEAA
jgi:PAS domain-containing protein